MVLSKLHIFILVVLIRMPMHPYAIRLEIIELSKNRFWPAYSTIYSNLKSLESKKLIQETDDSGYWLRARKSVPYELTEKGLNLIEKELDNYSYVLSMGRLWLKQAQKPFNTFGL